MMDTADVPPYHELLWPTLQAVTELGGSASIGEIAETVIKRQGFSDAQLAMLHNNGPGTEISYRLAWARSYLKGMSLLTNSARGIWALTTRAQPWSRTPLAPIAGAATGSVSCGRHTWWSRGRHAKRGRRGTLNLTKRNRPVPLSYPRRRAGKSSCWIS